jgi:(2Fe-2S) ferredoxin
MPKFEHHIFVCTNQREAGHPRGSCDSTGSGELHSLFKTGVAVRGLKGRVRANKAGCLDQCEHGPNVVIYPEAVWYGNVTAADVDEILDSHILGGKPVERLMIAEDCLNSSTCPHKTKK